MRVTEFECRPAVTEVFERLGGLPGRFLLEDVQGGTALVGAKPTFVLTAKDGAWRSEAGVSTSGEGTGDPFEILRGRLDEHALAEGGPDVPFAGGAVGYFSYDLGRSIEEIPCAAAEDVPTPDYRLGFYDSALWIDLRQGRCAAVSRSGDRAAVEFWRDTALSSCAPARPSESDRVIGVKLAGVRSNFTKAAYLRAIRTVKEYIAAGDVYQVNLSQRFQAELACTPWELYRALRRVNPAPKSCYIELGEPVLVSASPETFLTYDPRTRLIQTKPIKGTRPRGATHDEDERLAAELAASEKDRAENVMIVDMERNDLGRVAEYGSVSVPALWSIEKHPNVFQMVSTVEARLARDYDPVDLLQASFPGGSITGAPKIRSMEIIEELEPHRRGIYTGSAGYIDFGGRVDLSIVIRSFVISGGKAYFHAGGGIVADSDPEMEYQETLDKVSGLRAALAECGGQE